MQRLGLRQRCRSKKVEWVGAGKVQVGAGSMILQKSECHVKELELLPDRQCGAMQGF